MANVLNKRFSYLAFKLAVFCCASVASDGIETELRFDGGLSGVTLAESFSDDTKNIQMLKKKCQRKKKLSSYRQHIQSSVECPQFA